MVIEEYESPMITSISIEPDEKIMGLGFTASPDKNDQPGGTSEMSAIGQGVDYKN